MQRRTTKHKEAILEIFASHHLLTLQDVQDLLQDIDFSVIYRNVQNFVADGVLKEVVLPDAKKAYERAADAHDHFVCVSCDEISPIHITESLYKKTLPKGYSASTGNTVINGVCNKC